MKKLINEILSLVLSMILAFVVLQLYKITPHGYEFITAFSGGAFSVVLVYSFKRYLNN